MIGRGRVVREVGPTGFGGARKETRGEGGFRLRVLFVLFTFFFLALSWHGAVIFIPK